MDINLKELKEIDKELLQKIINQIDEEDIEDLTIDIDNKSYGFSCIEDDAWEDDGRGKYFYKCSKYVLGLFCGDESWKFVEKYNVVALQCVTKTGSYYTDWYYEYYTPKFSYAYEEVVPEQIIPAYTRVAFKDLDIK